MATRLNRELTEAEFEELERWASAGFDPATLRARPGRPSISDLPGEHSPRLETRVSPTVKRLFVAKAAAQGLTPSQLMRLLVYQSLGASSGRRSR